MSLSVSSLLQVLKGNRNALESLLTLVCESQDSVRAVADDHFCWEFECKVGVVSEASPAHRIRHLTLRSLWQSKFPADDEVPMVDFLAALEDFLTTVLLMSPVDVEALLNASNKESLAKQLLPASPVNNLVRS